MPVAIRIENLSKLYRLGEVGTGTISHDLNRWWARVRGKDDPYAIVGQENRRDQAAKSDYAWALRDINLEVEQGEVLGIIGPNGAGKSTLLKLISRITSPTSGFIRAKGRIASLLEVGTGMHPEMTARENIYLNGAILGMKRHEITRKFDEIIDFAGCRMYVDTPVKRYSSGMRVRLGFAVAAFLEPEILIVDEVLAAGDAEFQKRAIGKMQDVSANSGRTILFVSHNMAAVQQLCNSAVVLESGRCKELTSVQEAIRNYLGAGLESSAVTDLSNVQSRRGNGLAAFCEIRLKDEAGNLSRTVPAGAQLTIELLLKAKGDAVKGAEVGVVVSDSYLRRVFRLQMREMMREPYARIWEELRVSCVIPRLLLVPGTYFLTVGVSGTDRELYDHVANACSFTVLESDIYGTGVCPASVGGVAIAEGDWILDEVVAGVDP